MSKRRNVVSAYVGTQNRVQSEVHLLTVEQLEQLTDKYSYAKLWIVYDKPDGLHCFFTVSKLRPWSGDYYLPYGMPVDLYKPLHPYTYIGILHDKEYESRQASSNYAYPKCICDSCTTDLVKTDKIRRFKLIEFDHNED